MARKKDVVKKIDIKTKASGAPLPLIQEDQPVPPAFYTIPAPDTLISTGQAIQRSTQAPLVMVALSWQEAPNIAPDYYNVEYSEFSDFSNVQRRRANTTSATIDSLKANGFTYYFRVQTVSNGIYSEFSDVLSVVTMTDVTIPPDVTGATASYQNSDLVITYTIPQSEILKDIEIKIYDSTHTTLYGTFYVTASRFVWTAEQNIYTTGGTPLKQVSVDVHTRSWSNQLSTGINVTATAPLPSTPIGYTSNWISDTGVASADFTTAWLAADNAASYDITVDGNAFSTKDLQFVYRYDKNVAQHTPTLPSGKASFIWTLTAKDKLGQSSTPVNVTVTNAAPPSGVMSLTTVGGFSTIAATVALLGTTVVQDFDHYEWALSSGSSTIQSFNSVDPSVIFQLGVSGTYTPSVRMVDKFNQKSAVVSGAPVILDTLTIADLRAETSYFDSLGATSPALDIFKDDNVLASKTYSAVASGTYQWIEARRPLLDRYKTITFNAVFAGITLGYLQFSDGTTNTYYAGPITTTTAGAKVFTKYTVLATAQTNAVRLDLLGVTRYDLPNVQEARTVRINFSNYVSTTAVYEYYPRRLVQSDDIDAENIRGINIAAAAITADKISVINLQAVAANMGSLHMDGIIDIVSTGGIYQGTGTFASPTTGLKLFNNAGVGKLSTYNTGVEQVTLDTDGKLKAGGGIVTLDANGIHVNAGTFFQNYYNFINTTTGADYGGVGGNSASGQSSVALYTKDNAVGTTSQFVGLFAQRTGVSDASIIVWDNRVTPNPIRITSNTVVTGNLAITASTNFAATRSFSIFADNGYMSWNNAAGTEKWVAGLETTNSGRFILYNAAAAAYSLTIDTAHNAAFAAAISGTSITGTALTANNSSSPRITINTTSGANARSELYLSKNSAGGWLVGTDINGNNTNDFFIYDVANVTTRVHIGTNGNVGIGDVAATANRLRVKGVDNTSSNGALIVQNLAGATLMQNRDDNVNQVGTAWVVISDKSTKNDIEVLPHGLTELRQLKPKKYRTKDGNHPTFGLVAQDVQAIFPDMVVDLDGTLGLRYNDLIPVLINAVQELQYQIDALKKK